MDLVILFPTDTLTHKDNNHHSNTFYGSKR